LNIIGKWNARILLDVAEESVYSEAKIVEREENIEGVGF
jgi:hypothetical protein